MEEHSAFEAWWAVAGERQINESPKEFARSGWLARANHPPAIVQEDRLTTFLKREGRILPHEHGFEEP